jgi:hypothetical protein
VVQLGVAVLTTVVLLAGAYTLGYRAGSAGYEEGIAARNASHNEALARLEAAAAEARVQLVLEQEKERDEELRTINDAGNVAAIELVRIAGDRDRLTRRVQSLLKQAAGGNQARHGAVPGPAADPGSDAGTIAGGVLLEAIGTGLAGLTSDADTTLAQYTICHRYAHALKRKQHEVDR